MNPFAGPSSPFSSQSATKDAGESRPRRYEMVEHDLVVEHGASLPDICLKCGARGGEKPVTRAARSFGGAPVEFALCNTCARRWRMAERNRVVLGVAISFAGVMWCAMVLFVAQMPRAQGFVMAGAAVVFYPIIYYRFWITFRGMTVWAKSTAGGKATLAGVHPDARMNLARA